MRRFVLCDFCVVTRFGKLCRAHMPALIAACVEASSVVSVIVLVLPLHHAIKGKFIYPADLLFRSPN